jgi:hypothetical protein
MNLSTSQRPRRDASNDVCDECESPHHSTRNCPHVEPEPLGDY